MKKSVFLFKWMFAFGILFQMLPANSQLYINEFMASNTAAYPGPQGDYPDWIEIYNAGTQDIMLGGYFMSDDLNDTTSLYEIPDTYPDSVTVPAGGFIVFYANKDEEISVLNLNFKLKSDGEQIGLWTPDKEVVDTLTFGPQTTDISYGRFPDGSNVWYFMENFSPGQANIYTGIKENTNDDLLLQNSPNPFSSETVINFSLLKPDFVNITVYDPAGRKISTLANKNFPAGEHSVSWKVKDLKAGYYFYKLETSNNSFIRKAIVY